MISENNVFYHPGLDIIGYQVANSTLLEISDEGFFMVLTEVWVKL